MDGHNVEEARKKMQPFAENPSFFLEQPESFPLT
jgi:hypothetical protein